MSQLRLLPILSFASLAISLAGFLIAQPSGDSIRLTSPATPASETEASSIDLEGSVSGEKTPSKVTWVNQFGHRGSGTWITSGPGAATWTAPNIPLRPGVNLIAVTVVDAANQSVSLHVAVNRKPVAGTRPRQPLEIRTGTWRNQPIVYQVWNGQMVVEGDIILGPQDSSGPQAQPKSSKQRIAATHAPQPEGLSISYVSQLWPKVSGVYQVPYIITGSSANLSTAITTFNQTFSGLIQFVPQSAESNYVNMTVEGASGEGMSREGMVGGPQALTCGSGCAVTTWLHEMGHTIGLLHEHQRPDRASYITLSLTNADLPNVPGNFVAISVRLPNHGPLRLCVCDALWRFRFLEGR